MNAITLRTRQRIGIAGSLPSQPLRTTNPLWIRRLQRPSFSALYKGSTAAISSSVARVRIDIYPVTRPSRTIGTALALTQ